MEKKDKAGGLSKAQVKELIAAQIKILTDSTGKQIALLVENEGVMKNLADALAALGQRVEAFEERLLALPAAPFLTEESVIDLIEAAINQNNNAGSAEFQPPFDPDWLDGLSFSSSERRKPRAPSDRPVHVPTTRPLTTEDVLAYSVGEDNVSIISRDGIKHVVPF